MKFVDIKNDFTFIPDYANDDEGLKEAFVEADKHNWSKDDLIAYDNVSIWEGDQKQEREFLIQKIQKAEEKGKEAKEIEAVIGLNRIGLTSDKIADALEITVEKVTQIIDNQTNK